MSYYRTSNTQETVVSIILEYPDKFIDSCRNIEFIDKIINEYKEQGKIVEVDNELLRTDKIDSKYKKVIDNLKLSEFIYIKHKQNPITMSEKEWENIIDNYNKAIRTAHVVKNPFAYSVWFFYKNPNKKYKKYNYSFSTYTGVIDLDFAKQYGRLLDDGEDECMLENYFYSNPNRRKWFNTYIKAWIKKNKDSEYCIQLENEIRFDISTFECKLTTARDGNLHAISYIAVDDSYYCRFMEDETHYTTVQDYKYIDEIDSILDLMKRLDKYDDDRVIIPKIHMKKKQDK